MGCEKGVEFYDKAYDSDEKYRVHYKQLSYYPVYQIAYGMITDIEDADILELGCGTGQFAQMLWDNGHQCYLGVDFSNIAIGIAQGKSPHMFEVGDIRSYKIDKDLFNTVVMIEVLEHINDDIAVIKNIPEGMNVIMSLPDFNDPGHVRVFRDKDSIRFRYGDLIDIQEMVRYQHWIVVKGVRNGSHHS
jgi:2-polyprenyl-3-methyl-5-hydroxy-6-metoxy-1,4-benzoquinol methylase